MQVGFSGLGPGDNRIRDDVAAAGAPLAARELGADG